MLGGNQVPTRSSVLFSPGDGVLEILYLAGRSSTSTYTAPEMQEGESSPRHAHFDELDGGVRGLCRERRFSAFMAGAQAVFGFTWTRH